MKNSGPCEQQSFFMTRMFHCFYNKTDYAETRAGGLTAGCSGPLKSEIMSARRLFERVSVGHSGIFFFPLCLFSIAHKQSG